MFGYPVRKVLFIASYGIFLALGALALQAIQYTYFIRNNALEIYAGLLALLFTIVGIWVGVKLSRPKAKLEPAKVIKHFIPDSRQLEQFSISPRELEVLQLMSEGLSNEEIAERLFVSTNTIKTHASSLFRKLEVSRRTQAIAKAKSLMLIR